MNAGASALAIAIMLTSHLAGAQAQPGDTPFSDAVARSVAAVFDTTKEVTLRGVVTTPMTPINRAGASYFKIDVRDDAGATTSWAVLVRKARDVAELKPGASVTVTGWQARDGSRRIESSPERVRSSSK